MMDILDYLEADQDALRDLIVEFKIAEEDSAHEAETFTALVSAAKTQSDAKEQFFQSLAVGSEQFAQVTRPLLEAIAGAKEVERMIECCTNRATWRSSVNIYCEMIENALDKESSKLLPALYDSLSAGTRRTLGKKYKLARGFRDGGSSSRKKDWQTIWARIINQSA
jgi:hypothetical protein